MIHVLVELRHEEDYAQADTLWNLISKIYLSTPQFERMDGDRRKTYAAGLIVEAYNHLRTLRRVATLATEEKPSFVTALEEYLTSISQSQQGQQGKKRRRESAALSSLQTSEGAPDLLAPWIGDLEFLPGMPMHFEDIDWLFWSLPSEDQFFAVPEQP